jgi:hypothetical protein
VRGSESAAKYGLSLQEGSFLRYCENPVAAWPAQAVYFSCIEDCWLGDVCFMLEANQQAASERIEYRESQRDNFRACRLPGGGSHWNQVVQEIVKPEFHGGVMSVQFRKLLLLTPCLLLVFACSLSRFRGGSESGTANGANNSSTTGSAFIPSSDARKDLHDAIDKLNTAYPYRLTETVSSSANSQAGMAGTRVVEFAASDRTHMKSTGDLGGNIEAITIGDKHYWYSGGKWTEGSMPRATNAGSPEFAKKVAELIKDVKYVGPQTVNGVACHVYTCRYDGSMGGQNWTGTGKFWIRAADGRLQQSDSDFKIGSFGGKSLIVYEYNVDIKVEKPSM